MIRFDVIVPLYGPVTVNYSNTPLIAWYECSGYEVVRIACLNVGANEVKFILCTSDAAEHLPGELNELTVPAGEQRSFSIADAFGLAFQLEAHTTTPGQQSQVKYVAKGSRGR